MKNYITKLFTVLLFLFTNTLVFATPTEDTPENPETPINTGLLWLMVAGIAFAFYYFYNQRRKVTK